MLDRAGRPVRRRLDVAVEQREPGARAVVSAKLTASSAALSASQRTIASSAAPDSPRTALQIGDPRQDRRAERGLACLLEDRVTALERGERAVQVALEQLDLTDRIPASRLQPGPERALPASRAASA